ncbi:hypothetical protein P170DRAFT_431396 [Aspergillus steynii IBT 23096]|uniref:Uncharacterized protein n=1 Tax=Aspergillus steynii IBT 23096 TaxID=1392250 RepID=A0A2I2FQR0_9EURO|nr:uncharacterized protein P170DRAFT_431404 [Aspergillus steynii IBT 23096]XP_024698326.1 uncharacterized protein P170DRAFT_481413 [Aspergillus steynii IBT 23096]XP_024698363.1 uncharacterized protein P170DRAFT_431396 [Aspergillus steynii IBT 23096]PLB42970.1 hypothetical protein P170DRAFT_431404 [Aspergillus steynii IBT 23096]PLB43024.1 hypothetical protein P170DRAFT_481413 [Aspergillus steynii IBT 23096]PLB43061.1 hypothetical protein P170DRAFT_431396 [Aspergillus steynii IBT 23096]
MALTRRPYLPASVFPPIPPGSPPRANWSGGGPPQVHSTRHQTTPGPFAPGTGPPPCLFGPAPTHPRTFCPRHRTAPVPFRSGAHPPPDLLPQAPDRPRAFCPGHHTPRTVLPRDLGRSHHVITPTRPPKAPSRANWSASGPLSRTSPLPARHHPPPCILPKPPPRQLVWRWATPGPFDQAPDHPRTAPVPFRSGAHPPPDLLPQAPCPPGGAPPSPATPAPGAT